MDNALPFVSVVIPVLNEGRSLESVLRALLGQDYPSDRFELLVVDGGSTDETLSVAAALSRDHKNVRVLSNAAHLSSAGRNIGARAARGDVIMFVDGHCEIPNGSLLRSLGELFGTTGADVMCRPQPLDTARLNPTQRAIALARASRLGHNPGSHIFKENEEGFVDPESSGAAYTRRVFDGIGLFDESFDACEDVDFNLRAREAGFRAFTSPRLTVRYKPRESLGALYGQMVRYGSGRARLFVKRPGRGSTGPVLLGALPLFLAALAVGSVFSQAAWVLFLWLILIYAVAMACVSVALSARSGIGLAPRVFAAFVTIHAGLAAGFWKTLLRRPRAGRAGVPAGGESR